MNIYCPQCGKLEHGCDGDGKCPRCGMIPVDEQGRQVRADGGPWEAVRQVPNISLRDYFAARALQGFVTAAAFNQDAENMLIQAGVKPADFAAFHAHLSYELANAMMEERKLGGIE